MIPFTSWLLMWGRTLESTRQQPPMTSAPSLTQWGISSSQELSPCPAQEPPSQVSPELGYTTKGMSDQTLLASLRAPVMWPGAEQLKPMAITFPFLTKQNWVNGTCVHVLILPRQWVILDCRHRLFDRLPSCEMILVLEGEGDPDREQAGPHHGVHHGQRLPGHGDGLYGNEAHPPVLKQYCSLKEQARQIQIT